MPADRTRRSRGARRQRGRPADELRGKLRPHDPFELIRWLAMSQPDPRKALAELVQNSLDAGARTIRVTRLRERGEPCLKVFDDGEGVLPEMDRPESLRWVATHVGHSRKRSLSPEERLRLLTQGQYGIGLLGFWSLGEMLEMRTAVPGQRPHRLILYRDRPDYRIEPLRGRLALDERWTEVVVVGLHREAMGALLGRRAADYLASELRGQLLSREVSLVVEDRMSRGRALKTIAVRPPRFLGERIEGVGPVEVPGQPPIRLEIHLSVEGAGDEERGLAVYSSGTLVATSFHDLAPLGLDHPPWTDPRLSGLVDFPGFRVAPGSRRGVLVDEASGAFALALAGLEPVLDGILESLERRRAEELDRSLIRDLQRAYRDFFRNRPRYAMLPVRDDRRDAPEASSPGGSGAPGATVGTDPAAPPGTVPGQAEASSSRRAVAVSDLLPPGPLAAVRIVPSPVRLEIGAVKRAHARGLDATGRPVEDPVLYEWSLTGAVGSLHPVEDGGETVEIRAGSEPAEGVLSVVARSRGLEARAQTEIEVLEELLRARAGEGIPEPELVHQPGAPWRSRLLDGSWQVNSAHREYRAVADSPALKLRYLSMLFAKEVVLRSHRDPRLDKPLEQLVEVAGYADRSLSSRRRGRSKKTGGS